MFRIFRFSIIISVLLLSASAGFGPSTAQTQAETPIPTSIREQALTPLKKASSPKTAATTAPKAHPHKKPIYSTAPRTSVMPQKTFRPGNYRALAFSGASTLWEKDQDAAQQSRQRSERQRAQERQQRRLLQKKILKRVSPQ